MRKSRRLSQLDLGLRAEVSTRHISFIETGRARPSRDVLLRLSEVMELPLRESNLLLASGGYAAAYTSLKLDAHEMKPVREALDIMLESHNPFPCLVVDGCWNILLANRTQQRMMGHLLPAERLAQKLNLLELMFDPAGFRPLITNWDRVAGHLLRRFRRQMLAFPHPDAQALYDRLIAMQPPRNWQQRTEGGFEAPMITADIELGSQKLRMFSTLSRFGTALDVGLEELVIESYFPADGTTRAFFMALETDRG
jgi:transcriptional regulator with XRE-family HTH domain